MRILFFHRWVGVHGGGTETHLLELVRRFRSRGHEISILTRQGKRFDDLSRDITVFRVSRNFRESDHSYEDFRVYVHTALFALKSLVLLFFLYLKGKRFDVISVHFATEALVARIFRFFTKTPFIFVLEGYTPLEAETARYANGRVAISQYEAGMYKKNHGVDSKVIYIGVDLNRYNVAKESARAIRSRYVGDDDIMVVTVCRLEPRKDIPTLLKAAAKVQERNARIKFVIAGGGISRRVIEEEIEKLGLEGTVILAGFVPDDELSLFYKAGDIFLLTSKEEWFGIVFLEAMASGLPIITTRVDACPEVVDGAGLFFEKGDFCTLSEQVLKLAQDQSLREGLSGTALRRSKEFDWEKQIILYEQAYKKVLKR